MYASVWSSEAFAPAATAPRRQRSHGRLVLDVTVSDGVTRPVRIAESGPSRVRIPNTPGGSLEAVMMNVGGGIACGDRFEIAVSAQAGSDLVMTTPAAERCYKSDGPVATMHVAAVGRLRCDPRLAAAGNHPLRPCPAAPQPHRRSRGRRAADDVRGAGVRPRGEGRAGGARPARRSLAHPPRRPSRSTPIRSASTARSPSFCSVPLSPRARGLWPPSSMSRPMPKPGSTRRASCSKTRRANAAPAPGTASSRCVFSRRILPRCAAPPYDFLTRFRGTPLPRVWHS